jgi:hypothetical protein
MTFLLELALVNLLDLLMVSLWFLLVLCLSLVMARLTLVLSSYTP